MLEFRAGNEEDRPFRRAPPGFVRKSVGGNFLAYFSIMNQREPGVFITV